MIMIRDDSFEHNEESSLRMIERIFTIRYIQTQQQRCVKTGGEGRMGPQEDGLVLRHQWGGGQEGGHAGQDGELVLRHQQGGGQLGQEGGRVCRHQLQKHVACSGAHVSASHFQLAVGESQ